MLMIERVRAVLVTASDEALMIKRIRPGMAPYWVLPGGHVDPGDPTLEAALAREILEELAGELEVLSLIHIEELDDELQFFYLGRIEHWSFADRTGPEFSEDGRGEYALDEIPLTLEALSLIDLKPAEIAAVVRAAVADGDLFSLPDLTGSDAVPSGNAVIRSLAAGLSKTCATRSGLL
jgi:8-oxo-dGTP pyrophosphatase MutT (NUDIX family)